MASREVSNADIVRMQDKIIGDYAEKYYDNQEVGICGLCSLCGNMGVIDTRGKAISGAGVDAGRLNYCICLNGRMMREQKAKLQSRDEAMAEHFKYVQKMREKHGV